MVINLLWKIVRLLHFNRNISLNNSFKGGKDIKKMFSAGLTYCTEQAEWEKEL